MRQRYEPGQAIGGFRLEERLHKGGMATLWRVTHPDIDASMLMKVPMILDGDDAEAIVGFEMEQMILPRLRGPHVPKVYAVGELTEEPFLVIERLPGRSLFPLIEAAPIPQADAIRLARAVAAALVDLHAQDTLHLDVKPSNIIEKPDGSVAFIDFGLSHNLKLPDLLAAEFRLPMGTGPYMAPEQILGNRSDRRSDIFAFGVLLYHLSTGARPFGFPRNKRQLMRRFWSDPVPPRRLVKDYPPWLQEIALRCLEVDPANRYQSAAQLAFDLAHPEQVQLTARAAKRKRDPWLARLRRRFSAVGLESQKQSAPIQRDAPILMACVDLSEGMETLMERLRMMTAIGLASQEGARLACVNVFVQSTAGTTYALDGGGQSIHLQRLVAVRDWARPLGMPADRVTFHVLEAADPASALIDFAARNHVDHVFIGARGASGIRRYLGSVSASVVAQSHCSVTVARLAIAPQGEAPAPSEAGESEAIAPRMA